MHFEIHKPLDRTLILPSFIQFNGTPFGTVRVQWDVNGSWSSKFALYVL